MKMKIKAKFVYEIVVDVPVNDTEQAKEIVEQQLFGQLNVAHHGAFNLQWEDYTFTKQPEEVTCDESS
jgi:hypothetical protein